MTFNDEETDELEPVAIEPKPLTHPFHIQLESAGHKLIRDESGEVDRFVCDADYHNGPGCELCGESWCHHCGGLIEQCPGKKP